MKDSDWSIFGASIAGHEGESGSLGRFLGFLQCLIQASFTIAGLDYVSTGQPGAAASPDVVATDRLRVQVLPDIVNAMVLVAHFPLVTAT